MAERAAKASGGPKKEKPRDDESAEAELLNWVSERRSSGRASSIGSSSETAPAPPPRQSRLSAAVAQVAREKHPAAPPRQSRLSAAVAQVAREKRSNVPPAGPPGGRANAAARNAAVGSEGAPPRRSEHPAAVARVAREKRSVANNGDGPRSRATAPIDPKAGGRKSSRLSMAVAAASASNVDAVRKENRTRPPSGAPVSKSSNPAVDAAELEILNWLQKKK
mmetsp:Transcript_32449/g.69101  ORF Transcript_32449/g.69101 Transcript_32449/m.69101 type:complete len:222 (+) Transcript_32449:1627-2292(+)